MQIEVRGQGPGGHPVRFLTFFGCDHGGWKPCGFVPVQYATSTVLVLFEIVLVWAYIPQSEDDYPVKTTIH